MLSLYELNEYVSLRHLSIRDIEAYCTMSAGHISNVLNGTRALTNESHDAIVSAINAAYSAKKKGDFKRPALDQNKNAIKESVPDKCEETTETDEKPKPRKTLEKVNADTSNPSSRKTRGNRVSK